MLRRRQGHWRGGDCLAACLLLTVLAAWPAFGALTREEAVDAASRAAVVRQALAGLPNVRVTATPPSERTSGSWIVEFGGSDERQPPVITMRVNPQTGAVSGVAWDPTAFELRRVPGHRAWSAEELAGVHTEAARDVLTVVGDSAELKPYFRAHPRVNLRTEYAPDAGRWIVQVYENYKFQGFITCANGAIVDVHLAGFNWTPSPAVVSPVALIPCLTGSAALLIAALLVFIAVWHARIRVRAVLGRLAGLYAVFVMLIFFAPGPWRYAAMMCALVALCAVLLWTYRNPLPGPSGVGLSGPLLTAVFVVAVVVGMAPLGVGEVDDSSRSATICARYLIEKGRLPYGLDIVGAGGDTKAHDRNTYAPLMYLVHVPAEWLVPTTYQEDGRRIRVGDAGWDRLFGRHSLRETASRCTVTLFFLAGLVAAAMLGRRIGGTRAAGICVILCLLGPPLFVAHFGCSGRLIPTVFVLWAFVVVDIPFLSGVLLGCGAATFFYPAFAIPLWAGWYRRRSRGAWPFIAGVAAAGVAAMAAIILLSGASSPVESIRIFLKETVLFQEGAAGMGGREDSFWGSFPLLRSWLHGPLTLSYLVVCLALFFRPRATSLRELLVLTTALFIGVEFWKSFGPGYMDWYFYLAVLALFWPDDAAGVGASLSSGGGPPRAAEPAGAAP